MLAAAARTSPYTRHGPPHVRKGCAASLPQAARGDILRAKCQKKRVAVAPSAASATRQRQAAAAATTAAAARPLPFFPDRRCVEEVQLPSLAECHHYINLTNGIEAVPRLQALGLPYKYVRLPSTRCEQQQFEQLMNDLDSDLLMRLALGQCCLVYDFGSRNKKRGAPRAVWYGLEFVRFALRRLWFGLEEAGPAYLRGYSVANVFERHVKGLSDGTKTKIRYYKRYIGLDGLPRLHMYGVYGATTSDGDQRLYSAMLRCCEGGDSGISSAAAATTGAAAEPGQQQKQQGSGDADLEARMQQALQAAAALPRALPPEQRELLLRGPDTHAAVESLLGMRLFMGGVSHKQYHDWAARTGFVLPDGKVEL